MNTTANFTVAKSELLPALKQLQKVEKSARKKESTLEVTIIDRFITLVIPGIQLQVKAVTSGTAKFTIRLWYFANVVNAEKDKNILFTLTENQLKLRGFSFAVLTTFFETDNILRSINLPVNYTQLDIASLYLSEKYTTDEIVFNNLDKQIVEAINKLNSDIDKIILVMKKYGFSRAEVESNLLEKLTQTSSA